MKLITVKLTDFQLGELAHKLSIVTEEPELQESYDIQQDDVDTLYRSLPRLGPASFTFDAKYLDLIIGELENDFEIFQDNASSLHDLDYARGASSLRAAINKIKAAARAAA